MAFKSINNAFWGWIVLRPKTPWQGARLALFYRKHNCNCEPRPAVIERQGSFMHGYDSHDAFEPEPKAGGIRIQLIEVLTHIVIFAGRYARTIVFYPNRQLPLLSMQTDPDMFAGIFQCIIHQIGQHTGQQICIAMDMAVAPDTQ